MCSNGGFPDGSVVKNPPATQETACSAGNLGWEDPLEKEMEAHSSILAQKISWTEECGRLHTVHRVASLGHTLVTKPQPPCSNGMEVCLERGKSEGRKTCFIVRKRTQAELDKWQWDWKRGDRWQRYS